MKILIVALYTILVCFISIAGYEQMPTRMWEDQKVDTTVITWERDPAFVASMMELQDDSMWTEILGLAITKGDHTTIIADIPTNNRELITFGHECLHAFGYTHK